MVLLSYEQHGFSGSKVLIGYPLINAMVLVGLPSTYHTGQGRLGGTSPITAKSAEIVIILFMGILLFFVFIWDGRVVYAIRKYGVAVLTFGLVEGP